MRTKGGAPYLALELVDPSGRIDARVWHDVELLDARFTEGDAVRVLGRVEKFRDRLQVDVRTLEAAPEADPADFAPAMRRDAEELDGFLEFLAAEIVHPGLAAVVKRFLSDDSMRASLRAPACCGDTPLVCRRAARAHGRGRDALPRDGAAAPASPLGPLARRGAPARRRPRRGAHLRPHLSSDRRRPPARSCPSRPAAGRGTRRAHSRQPPARSSCTRSRATTTHAPPAPPRRLFCTTRINSTRSLRRVPFLTASVAR